MSKHKIRFTKILARYADDYRQQLSEQEDKAYAKYGITTTVDHDHEQQLKQKELNKKDAEIESHKLNNQRLSDDNENRKEKSKKSNRLVNIWLISLLALIVYQLCPLTESYPKVSDEVLMVIFGATTIKVIGLYWLIIKDLFPGNKG